MSYIGNIPTTVAFLVDTFSGDGSDTTFTLSQAPANTSSILVAVSGVVQDPSTYSVSGTTLTFSAAPPSGSSNISVRFLGIPASGVTTTAYRTVTEFTATAGQTSFTVPSYTVGYIDVYRNGVMLGTADFTASSGTTVVLASGATAGDLIRTESFYVSSVLNAIPAVAGAVTTSYLLDGSVTKAKMAASGAWAPAGTVLQVVNGTYSGNVQTTSSTAVATGLSASITPTSTSSKILVITSMLGAGITGATAGNPRFEIYRNGSSITYFDDILGYGKADSNIATSMSYLDSPSSTSSLTYAIYWLREGSGTAYINNYYSAANRTVSTITLMEIAG